MPSRPLESFDGAAGVSVRGPTLWMGGYRSVAERLANPSHAALVAGESGQNFITVT